jgi:hypothetical protein
MLYIMVLRHYVHLLGVHSSKEGVRAQQVDAAFGPLLLVLPPPPPQLLYQQNGSNNSNNSNPP